jgi:hypothetical protein
MGAIVINSPYSGKPVKVREQDIGRAVRDEEGRIFYLVQRADGSGYYSAMTRKGSAREEEAYDAMAAKGAVAKASGATHSARQIHDASGRRRSNVRGKLVILALLILVIVVVIVGYRLKDTWRRTPAPPANILTDPPAAEPQGAAPATTSPLARADDSPDISGIINLIHQDAAAGLRTFETPQGLRITIDRAGSPGGRQAARRQTVVVRYHGYLDDGTLVADSKRDGYEQFALSTDHVIPGLVEGIAGMTVGELRTITIPPVLAYGTRGIGNLIPPDATLRYEVELLDVR